MCRTDQVAIRSYNGEVAYFNNKRPLASTTVLELKKYAVEKFDKSASDVRGVRLIHRDKPLDVDSAPLSNYGVKAQSMVQMVKKVDGG